jgi:EF hand domain-containing protein
MAKSAWALLILLAASLVAAAQEKRPADMTTSAARSRGYDPYLTWASVWGDREGRGVYTCDEWKRYVGKLFDQADRNRDGFVDAKEFEAIRKADPMFKDADIGYFDDNRDGRLSRAEFVNQPNPFFARYDKKGTCRVTIDEIMDQANAEAPRGR